jgi:hypothetical protein
VVDVGRVKVTLPPVAVAVTANVLFSAVPPRVNVRSVQASFAGTDAYGTVIVIAVDVAPGKIVLTNVVGE